MAVGPLMAEVFRTHLDPGLVLREILKVVEIGRGGGVGSGKHRAFVVSYTFPGFSAGSWKVHVRTWLVRTGKLNIPHSVHLSGYRPILGHAALNKQHFFFLFFFFFNVHLYRPLIWKSAFALGAGHAFCR